MAEDDLTDRDSGAERDLSEKTEPGTETARADRARSIGAFLLVLAGIVAGANLRIWAAARTVVYPYDAYYYLATARSLASGAGYSFRGEPHVRFPPGYPMVVSVFDLVMPVERAGIWVSILSWAGVAVVTYFIGKRMAGRAAGAAASVLTSVHPTSVQWGYVPLSESLFTLLFSFSILALVRALQDRSIRSLVYAGIIGGAAMLTRYEAASLLPIFGLVAYWRLRDARADRDPQVARIVLYSSVGVILLLLIPGIWWLRNYFTPTDQLLYTTEFADYVDLSLGPMMERLGYFAWTGQRQPLLALLASGGVVLGLVRRSRLMGIVTLWLAAFVVGHIVWYYRSDRFLMAGIPPLCIAASYLGVECIRVLSGPGRARKLRYAAAWGGGLFALGLVTFWSLSTGKGLALWHIEDLNRDWGGSAIVGAARGEALLEGAAGSNRGALFAFYAGDDSIFVSEVAFDRDELGGADSGERVSELRKRGISRVYLVMRERDPALALRNFRLEGLDFTGETRSSGELEGSDHIVGIFEVPRDPEPKPTLAPRAAPADE